MILIRLTMPYKETRPTPLAEQGETLGHQIEYKVGEFLEGVFDCVERIEATENNGANDGKGVDLVVVFKNGKKLAIDVTTEDKQNPRFIEKWASMVKSPMTVVAEELNENGEIVVEKTNERIPKAIVRVDGSLWEDCLGYEKLDYVPDELKVRLEKEKKEIITQIVKQIEFMMQQLKGVKEYQDKGRIISEILEEELEKEPTYGHY